MLRLTTVWCLLAAPWHSAACEWGDGESEVLVCRLQDSVERGESVVGSAGIGLQ